MVCRISTGSELGFEWPSEQMNTKLFLFFPFKSNGHEKPKKIQLRHVFANV